LIPLTRLQDLGNLGGRRMISTLAPAVNSTLPDRGLL
jgi:hypothetical protein